MVFQDDVVFELLAQKWLNYIVFFRNGFPGRENAPRPRGSILRHTRGSQRPYIAKNIFVVFFEDFGL